MLLTVQDLLAQLQVNVKISRFIKFIYMIYIILILYKLIFYEYQLK